MNTHGWTHFLLALTALLSLLTIVGGLHPVLTRRPRGKWMAYHANGMAWSCVGLLAAAASESLTRWTPWGFWWTVLGATVIVCAAGWVVIVGRVPAALRRLGSGRL